MASILERYGDLTFDMFGWRYYRVSNQESDDTRGKYRAPSTSYFFSATHSDQNGIGLSHRSDGNACNASQSVSTDIVGNLNVCLSYPDSRYPSK